MQKVSEYLKLKVLAALDMAEGKNYRQRTYAVARMGFEDERGVVRHFTWRTIETWRVRYQKHGITVMCPKPRSDKGTTRKIEPERVQEAIDQARPFLRPGFKISQLYRVCIEKGFLQRDLIAPNSFRRIVNRFEMLKPDPEVQSKERLAFSKRYANEMWQADTLFGPFVPDGKGEPKQTKLVAFLDDASRLCCHGEFFHEENTATLKATLKAALYKRGVPQTLYVDNGSIYAGKDITVICGRLGILLCHTPVRDAAAKGKVERFFRSVREQFLSRVLDLTSLASLNAAFVHWVEDEYNCRVHSTLGLKPVDRFALDLSRIRFLQTNEANEELFYGEEERSVKADNTFSFRAKRYEAPVDLRNRTIVVRFPQTTEGVPVVYYKGERQGEASLLDWVANDRPRPEALAAGIGLPFVGNRSQGGAL